jgi:outer membrane protein TolC
MRSQWLIALVVFAVSASVRAADKPTALPDPLSLQQALDMAAGEHPELQRARADIEAARAEQLSAESRTGIRSAIEARARWVEPNEDSPLDQNDDHRLALTLDKNLYDFGRSRESLAAADAAMRGSNLNLEHAVLQQQLDTMRIFFDVLLADLAFLRENEGMAIGYVRLDRLRTRRELGQVSDIDVLDQERRYMEARRRLYDSEASQRTARARLAIAINRPGELPANVQAPELSFVLQREVPDVDELQKTAEQQNPELQAMREQLQAAQHRVEMARAGSNPTLSGEVELAANSRKSGTADDARIGLLLTVPLTTGGRTEAATARAVSELHRRHADYEAARNKIRQQVLELWSELRVLKAQLDEANVNHDYSEIHLDQARSLYEMEARPNLGDAMVQITDAKLYQAETLYKLAMAWANLDALLKQPFMLTAVENKGNTVSPVKGNPR